MFSLCFGITKEFQTLGNLIGSVTWTPKNPAAGASVKIDVSDSSGKLYQNQGSTRISIKRPC